MKNLKPVEQLDCDALNSMINEYCQERGIPLELVTGQKPVFYPPTFVIESTPKPKPDPFWEMANQVLNDAFQSVLMQRLNERCDGLGTPSRLLATTTTGENYTLPYKTKDEWLQALEKARLAINPPLEWPADWPTDANFYRINVDTPIFYKYQHGQIKRWVKYAKCWVDSCIPDWYAFCTQNTVEALRVWPAVSIAMLQECSHRNNMEYMTLIHGEWPTNNKDMEPKE